MTGYHPEHIEVMEKLRDVLMHFVVFDTSKMTEVDRIFCIHAMDMSHKTISQINYAKAKNQTILENKDV